MGKSLAEHGGWACSAEAAQRTGWHTPAARRRRTAVSLTSGSSSPWGLDELGAELLAFKTPVCPAAPPLLVPFTPPLTVVIDEVHPVPLAFLVVLWLALHRYEEDVERGDVEHAHKQAHDDARHFDGPQERE